MKRYFDYHPPIIIIHRKGIVYIRTFPTRTSPTLHAKKQTHLSAAILPTHGMYTPTTHPLTAEALSVIYILYRI